MKAYDVSNQDAYRLLKQHSEFPSMGVAKALVGVLQSMSDVYPDTDDIPESVWTDLVIAAEERS